MGTFDREILVLAVALASILAVACMIFSWRVRARNRARLEMKHHVQNLEVDSSA